MNKELKKDMNLSHKELIELANTAVKKGAKEVSNDPYRLNYHLMAPANWMNDPNGLVFYKGEYHVFYQHYPYAPKWGPMHWGHAKSKDLFHWEHLPVALAPSESYEIGDVNGYGCWSGSAVDDDGVLTLLYTAHIDDNDPEETQCVARSTDGINFEKYENNPVIKESPEKNCFGFRDPKVWKHEDKWYMIIGSGSEGSGKIFLYQSNDLNHWEYVGVPAQSDGTMGEMWECPDLFPLADHHVLVISPMNTTEKNLYLVGDMNYETGKFSFEDKEVLDYGSSFYAAQTFTDDKNRRILIAWMEMWGSKTIEEAEKQEQGWVGAMTIPRELIISDNGKVLMRPVEEHKSLRNKHYSFDNITLDKNEVKQIENFNEVSYELEATIDLTEDVEEVGIALRCSESNKEETVVAYKVKDGLLEVDKSLSGSGDLEINIAPLETASRIKLQIFVDTSSIEVFANEGEKVITNRIYPSEDSNQLNIFTKGGKATFKMEAWTIDNVTGE